MTLTSRTRQTIIVHCALCIAKDCALCIESGFSDGDADAAVFEFAAFDGFEKGAGDVAVDGGI